MSGRVISPVFSTRCHTPEEGVDFAEVLLILAEIAREPYRPANLSGLVLGCSEADFCNEILFFQHFQLFILLDELILRYLQDWHSRAALKLF